MLDSNSQISLFNEDSLKANVTVSSDDFEVILLLTGMAPNRRYPVHVAAVNSVGEGPKATAALTIDEVI